MPYLLGLGGVSWESGRYLLASKPEAAEGELLCVIRLKEGLLQARRTRTTLTHWVRVGNRSLPSVVAMESLDELPEVARRMWSEN